MPTIAQQLKTRIDGQLDELPVLEELSDTQYHSAHERFEGASNQRALIVEWMQDFVKQIQFSGDRPTRLLSVGCGGGVMDQRITSVFTDYVDALSIVGVDPNPEHTEAFRKQFEKKSIEVDAHTGMFEDFDDPRPYDVIHFVHCLYYFEHIEPELRKAMTMLAPGGALVILQAPNEALNHLADRVWKKQFNQSAWFSDDVIQVFNHLQVDYNCQRLDAEVEVTECFEANSEVGFAILDFIVQANTRNFSQPLQNSVRESLRSICRSDGNRLFCQHPVDVIIAQH